MRRWTGWVVAVICVPPLAFGAYLAVGNILFYSLVAKATSTPPSADLALQEDKAEATYARGDYSAAFGAFSVLANLGVPAAENNLGSMYEKGQSVPQDYTEAIEWYRKAAVDQFAMGQSNLGAMYLNGHGVAVDYPEAITWFRAAAEQGYAEAQKALGAMLAKGQGGPPNYSEAIRWLTKAADQGNAEAAYDLGAIYYNGDGIPADYAVASNWFRKAAQQGYVAAEYQLCAMHSRSEGLPQDHAEVLTWCREAADKDDARAETMLGFMYFKGQDVEVDKGYAEYWFRRAAAHGGMEAQKQLDRFFPQPPSTQSPQSPAPAAEAPSSNSSHRDEGTASTRSVPDISQIEVETGWDRPVCNPNLDPLDLAKCWISHPVNNINGLIAYRCAQTLANYAAQCHVHVAQQWSACLDYGGNAAPAYIMTRKVATMADGSAEQTQALMTLIENAPTIPSAMISAEALGHGLYGSNSSEAVRFAVNMCVDGKRF